MNRRGQMLILLSTLIVGVTVVYFLLQSSTLPEEARLSGIQQQHMAANSLGVALEKTLLPRILVSSANAALRAIVQGMDAETPEISSEQLDDLLTRTMLDGGTGGLPVPEDSVMYNRTIPVQLELLANLTNETVRLVPRFENVDDLSVRVAQDEESGEWFLRIEANVVFSLNSSVAYWYRNATIVTNMSIFGLPDPYLYRKGAVTDTFHPEIDVLQVSPRGLDVVREAIAGRKYFKDPQGLCFIDRLMGREDAPTHPACAIGAFINPAEPFPLSPRTASYMDYCFLNEDEARCGTQLREVKGITFPNGNVEGFLLNPSAIGGHELDACGLICTYVVEDGQGSWDCQNGEPSCSD